MCGTREICLGIFFLAYLSGTSSSENTTLNMNLTKMRTTNKISVTQAVSFDTPATVSESYSNTTTVKWEIHNVANLIENDTVQYRNVTLPFTSVSSAAESGLLERPKYLLLDSEELKTFGLKEAAGFAAVGFLVFAIIGYAGLVLWRTYLQNKYGNGQTLIAEDVYDISDLRHFEI